MGEPESGTGTHGNDVRTPATRFCKTLLVPSGPTRSSSPGSDVDPNHYPKTAYRLAVKRAHHRPTTAHGCENAPQSGQFWQPRWTPSDSPKVTGRGCYCWNSTTQGKGVISTRAGFG